MVRVAQYFQAFIIGCALSPLWMKFQIHFIYNEKNTYISSINTNTYPQDKIKKLLDKFNKIGDNKIVNYDGVRPIHIYEMDLGARGIGLAEVGIHRCNLFVEPGLSDAYLYEVLIHEYLHCMFYEHLDVDGDLMCSDCALGLADYDNFKQYADDLKRTMHGERQDLQ